MAQIFIGTVLLERNRWTSDKQPSYRVSEWMHRFAADGFDGMELWENHAAPEELTALADGPLPVAVFNSYAGMNDAETFRRQQSAEQTVRLLAPAVKFNVGADPALWDAYLANAGIWLQQMPSQTRLLCECHGGTVLETPEAARRAFAVWDNTRFGAIIHPFYDLDGLRAWFRALGPQVIAHSHVQTRAEDGTWLVLEDRAAHVKEALHIMREEGFQGTYTLEFTRGTATPEETIEGLYASALRDLAFLREALA
jgi:sugar phosphate isomerase/epimerase